VRADDGAGKSEGVFWSSEILYFKTGQQIVSRGRLYRALFILAVMGKKKEVFAYIMGMGLEFLKRPPPLVLHGDIEQ